jgi:hypothetical protein
VIVVNDCGAVSSGNVTIVANATDNGSIVGARLEMDGAVIGSNITTGSNSPYSVIWNTSAATNGCHQISVIAQDDAGNIGTASMWTMVSN